MVLAPSLEIGLSGFLDKEKSFTSRVVRNLKKKFPLSTCNVVFVSSDEMANTGTVGI